MKRQENITMKSQVLNFFKTLIIGFSLLTGIIFAQKGDETAKLLPDDGAANDFFGNAVATDGEIAVVGAWFDDDIKGSAYVFRRDGNNWSQEQKLTASDGTDYDFFGTSVDVNGNDIVVGATGAGNKGAAYVFHYNGSSWTQTQKLTASNGVIYDDFGSSVALSDDYLVVGAESAQSLQGAVYVFEKNGSNWQESDILTGPLYGASLGTAVDVSGDVILAGAGMSSYAFVFMLDGATWVMTAELEDLNGSIYDEFGETVAISGNLAIVGATHHQNGNGATGAAYIYHRQGSNWVEEVKLVADDGALDDHFGVVAMNGKNVAIGAFDDDDYGLDAGSVYLYQKEGDTWQFKEKMLASDGFAGDELGSSVAIYSDVILTGAPNDNDNGSSAGSAYIFNYNPITGIKNGEYSSIAKSGQNFPNPFTDKTSIRYNIDNSSPVRIKIYALNGNLVKTLIDEGCSAGTHEITWDSKAENGCPVKPGIYFYRIETNDYVLPGSMVKF